LDWNNIKEIEGNPFQQTKKLNVHSPNSIILYRHFVELITRTSHIKYPTLPLHRAIEKVIDTKLVNVYEKFKNSITS
jgi:hypothetical protein